MTASSNLAEMLFGAHARELRCVEAPLDETPRFLHEVEEAHVGRAILKRRREFATGRRLAHELLAELGLDAGPLLAGPTRAALWPSGARGSISHGAGRCAVVVARAAHVRGIGLDVEADGPLARKLWRIVLRPAEQARAESLGADAELWAKLVFSAKETTYKALSADVGRVLEFREVEIELELAGSVGGFRAHLLAPEADALAPVPLAGRYVVGDGRVLTALRREA